MNICKAINCRFKTTHITAGHKCGKCGKYGHGQVECGNLNLMNGVTNNIKSTYYWSYKRHIYSM